METMKGNITEQEAQLIMTATMEHGATLREIHSIPDDTMENIYAHAYQYYKEGRLDEAESFFNFLCMYDLKNPDYFIGLGAVNQLKKNYHKACDFYALAYVMTEDNFNPVFYSGQCQLLMGNVVKALQCFEIICQRCTDELLVNKAQIYMETIRHNRSEDVTDENADTSDEAV
ncbi:type III secretion system translocator chaperone SicA [Cedecea davisae]|uniref:Type III secretion system translocator chaperone SicA n=1 Tax=Cedecea davisae TaxID=158484 RepID=A0ABS6DBD4_9ENTR|nr:type III secretion system translocator chaperone SicA [Cedecea davisae]MBU4680531.1 type III secretion system translocator chaperone SicA [Cedecea davisae]MBU4685023.1 type III secretion system translocator chaperone SicA [Cedecea davisae]